MRVCHTVPITQQLSIWPDKAANTSQRAQQRKDADLYRGFFRFITLTLVNTTNKSFLCTKWPVVALYQKVRRFIPE